MIGRQLHQYLVTEKIGEGGMGVVWKARDVRLDRDVALKVLPLEHLRTPERRERFIREAKAASALNHSNIVTVYEIDSDQGIDFIAMEYIAGRSLAERLRQAPIDVPQAVHISAQVADALGHAHAAHIVHRDLKPGNIMVSDDGRVNGGAPNKTLIPAKSSSFVRIANPPSRAAVQTSESRRPWRPSPSTWVLPGYTD